MKKVELLFYRTNPSEKNQGMKYVLFQITDAEGGNTYDWGFALWDGLQWDMPEPPPDFTLQVHSWSNNVDPAIILTDPTKIIPVKGRFDL